MSAGAVVATLPVVVAFLVELGPPQRMGVATRTASAQNTRCSNTSVSWSVGSIWVMLHGQVQAWALFE